MARWQMATLRMARLNPGLWLKQRSLPTAPKMTQQQIGDWEQRVDGMGWSADAGRHTELVQPNTFIRSSVTKKRQRVLIIGDSSLRDIEVRICHLDNLSR